MRIGHRVGGRFVAQGRGIVCGGDIMAGRNIVRDGGRVKSWG